MKIRWSSVKLLMLICVVWQFAANSWAQNYPSRVVRLIVPYSAGSGSDIVGRIIAGGLADAFGQQVVVDNRAGAAGSIGAQVAAQAPPDGYTLLLLNVSNAVNVTLYRKLPYDLLRDFAPVAMFDTSPAVIVVHPSLPVKSLAELVKLAKAKPGEINVASAGSGTFTFLAMAIFNGRADVDMLHVPYRSGAEAITSVVAGETSVYFAPISTSLPHIRQGKLRPLAVTSAKRMALLAEKPTVAELGYPGYEVGNWHGLAVPAGTPKEAIAVINKAAMSALKNPTLTKRLEGLGFIPAGSSPEQFTAYIKLQIETLGKVIRAFKLSAGK